MLFSTCYYYLHAVALEVLLSKGGLKFVLPYQRLRGFAPQTPLLVTTTNFMRFMHFTSVKVTWRLLDNSSFPLASLSLTTAARLTFVNVLTSFE